MILGAVKFDRAGTEGPVVYPVSVASGLRVTRSASDVATTAMTRLLQLAAGQGLGNQKISVSRVSAVRHADVSTIEAEAGGDESVANTDAPKWIVRLEGPFIAERHPPGVTPLQTKSGYFQIDDATGQIIGMGMP